MGDVSSVDFVDLEFVFVYLFHSEILRTVGLIGLFSCKGQKVLQRTWMGLERFFLFLAVLNSFEDFCVS